MDFTEWKLEEPIEGFDKSNELHVIVKLLFDIRTELRKLTEKKDRVP